MLALSIVTRTGTPSTGYRSRGYLLDPNFDSNQVASIDSSFPFDDHLLLDYDYDYEDDHHSDLESDRHVEAALEADDSGLGSYLPSLSNDRITW